MGTDVSAEFCGMRLDPAILNASGIFSFLPVLKRLQDHFGGLVMKSVSYHERDGYGTPVFAQMSGGSFINAVGLSNPGYAATLEELREHYRPGKPLIVSLFGSEASEVGEMVRGMRNLCDAFEMNMSCPHPRPEEKAGRSLGSDPEAVREFITAMKGATGKPVIAKLSHSLESLEDSARAAIDAGADAIASTNAIGPTDSYHQAVGSHVLSNRVGGLSGPGIMDKGLDSVRRIRKVDGEIPIIGIGGISSGRDVVEYVKAGADAVAIGSAFDLMPTGRVGEFMDSVVEGLRQEMEKLGAVRLNDLRG
jgi:dihydroorotate dehydrogenase (NAD+) catalytic subunit